MFWQHEFAESGAMFRFVNGLTRTLDFLSEKYFK
jgi:hypothetical protein